MTHTMRRHFIFAAAALLTLTLTGCAGGFARPSTAADYGTPPQNYEASIKAHFETLLKDAESARWRFTKPRKSYGNKGLVYGGGVAWTGYVVKAEVNAKNSFGGYSGFKPYLVIFYGDHIRDVEEYTGYNLVYPVE